MKLNAIRLVVLVVTLFSSTTITTAATSMDEMIGHFEAVTKLLPKSVHEMNERMTAIEQKLSSVDELRRRVDQLEAANSILIHAANECTRNIEKLTTAAAAQQSPGARHLLSTTTTSSTTTATTTRPGVHLNTGTGLYFVSDGGDRVAASFTHDENHTLALNGTLRLTESGGMLGTRTINVPSDYATLKQAIESIEPSDYPVPGRVVIQLAPGNHSITSAIVAEKLNRVGGVVIQGDTSTSGGSRGQYVLQVAGLGVDFPYALSFKDCGRVEVIGLTIIGTNSTAIDSSGVYCEYGEQLIVSNLDMYRLYHGIHVYACPLDMRGNSFSMMDVSDAGIVIKSTQARLRASSSIRVIGASGANASSPSTSCRVIGSTVTVTSTFNTSGFYYGFHATSAGVVRFENTVTISAEVWGIFIAEAASVYILGTGNTIWMVGSNSRAIMCARYSYAYLENLSVAATGSANGAYYSAGAMIKWVSGEFPAGFATHAYAEYGGFVYGAFTQKMTTWNDGSIYHSGGCLPITTCAATGNLS